jgi:hypothetical protein
MFPSPPCVSVSVCPCLNDIKLASASLVGGGPWRDPPRRADCKGLEGRVELGN